MNTHEILQDVFHNVKKNALLYLTSPEIQEKYKNPATKIDIRIDDLSHLINARITKTGAATYDICIFAGLVAALDQEGAEVLQDFPELFEKVNRGNSKKINMARSSLLYIWLDFIFCHEWAHAICGHLDFNNRVVEWYEQEISGSPQSELEEHVSQHIEAEADSYAAKFSLARFSMYWEGMSVELYGERDDNIAFRDYIMALLLLFRFFECQHENAKMKKRTHPLPFNRAFVAMAFIKGEYRNIPGLPKISMEGKNDQFSKVVADFYVKTLKMNSTKFVEKSLQANVFMEKVGKTLESLEIKKYRLFK